ncbi:hypothetical protein CP973_31560 [Streptomyces albofaciens JCM 4342]|nr:hypothetical protein CP973_31560 [Streptomyces albofaciens JCM 4342]
MTGVGRAKGGCIAGCGWPGAGSREPGAGGRGPGAGSRAGVGAGRGRFGWLLRDVGRGGAILRFTGA